MATSDIDQKALSSLALRFANIQPLLSNSLYQVLGLSIILAPKLYRARKLRKLDTSRDTKSLSLYHHIIWLAREGLTVLEVGVLPYTQKNQCGSVCLVLVTKLRASFFHIFCLFHNDPPVSQFTIPHNATHYGNDASSSRQGIGQGRKGAATAAIAPSGSTKPGTRLRDPIPSITSDASYITNPYAVSGNGTADTSPPSLDSSGYDSRTIPHPSDFLLPSLNFVPRTAAYFSAASDLAAQLLPGSHPLRLSVAVEHSAFLWDCAHEHGSARNLARLAIRDVYRAQEGMDDAEFEDAAEMVAVLGAILRRAGGAETARGLSNEKSAVRENGVNGIRSGETPSGLDGPKESAKVDTPAISNGGLKASSVDQHPDFQPIKLRNPRPTSATATSSTNGGIRSHERHNENFSATVSKGNNSMNVRPKGSTSLVNQTVHATATELFSDIDEHGLSNDSGTSGKNHVGHSTTRRSTHTPPNDGGYRLFPSRQHEANGFEMRHGRAGSTPIDHNHKARNRDRLSSTERSGSVTPRAGGPVLTPEYGTRRY